MQAPASYVCVTLGGGGRGGEGEGEEYHIIYKVYVSCRFNHTPHYKYFLYILTYIIHKHIRKSLPPDENPTHLEDIRTGERTPSFSPSLFTRSFTFCTKTEILESKM